MIDWFFVYRSREISGGNIRFTGVSSKSFVGCKKSAASLRHFCETTSGEYSTRPYAIGEEVQWNKQSTIENETTMNGRRRRRRRRTKRRTRMLFEVFGKRYPSVWRVWCNNNNNNIYTGGENKHYTHVVKRGEDLFRKTKTKHLTRITGDKNILHFRCFLLFIVYAL